MYFPSIPLFAYLVVLIGIGNNAAHAAVVNKTRYHRIVVNMHTFDEQILQYRTPIVVGMLEYGWRKLGPHPLPSNIIPALWTDSYFSDKGSSLEDLLSATSELGIKTVISKLEISRSDRERLEMAGIKFIEEAFWDPASRASNDLTVHFLAPSEVRDLGKLIQMIRAQRGVFI